MTRSSIGRFVIGLAFLSSAAPAQTPRSVERAEVPAPEAGPLRPGAPLPPEGPYCPGEPDQKCAQEPAEAEGPVGDALETEPPQRTEQEAGTADTDSEPEDEDEVASSSALPAEREIPDYDGVSEGPELGRKLLWVPRIALAPLYLVSEFLVRRPVGWVVRRGAQEDWAGVLVDLFTFGPNRQAGIVPTALFDFGFRPSVGLFAFWNDAGWKGHDLRLRAATGGLDWWQGTVVSRLRREDLYRLELRAAATSRPDFLFHELGPTSSSQRYRYGMRRYDFEMRSRFELWRSSELEVFSGLRGAEFAPATGCCGDPTIEQGLDNGAFDRPPGLGGYEIFRSGGRARLDTRKPRFPEGKPSPVWDRLAPPGSGVQLEAQASAARSLRLGGQTSSASPLWVDAGGLLGGYVALPGFQRTLGLEVAARLTEPLQGEQVPFTEQAQLGGSKILRGFLDGRLVGHSAVAARVRYDWPVWVLLDGVLEYAVGSVYGRQFQGFEPGLLRQSFAFGLESSVERDHSLQILIAAGTEPFRDGSRFESFRFVIGGNSGI